jgi:hypothetical protein
MRDSADSLARSSSYRLPDILRQPDGRFRGLEALGDRADIVAERDFRGVWYGDVKYIGQDTGDFIEIVDALARDGVAVGTRPLFGAANYLLFRIFVRVSSSSRSRFRSPSWLKSSSRSPSLEPPRPLPRCGPLVSRSSSRES